MPSRIFRIFGSYDFHGKAFPGIAFIIGVLSFLPVEWFVGWDNSTIPSHLVVFTIVLIVVILAGTLIGEAVYALAIYIEKMIAWIANRMKNILKIINNKEVFQSSEEDGEKRYELEDIEQDGQSTLPDNEEQIVRNRLERWIKNWKYGLLEWINKRLNGTRLALIRHRILFTSKIIRPLSHPHEGPKKTSISDLDGVQQYLVRTVEDEFAVIHREEFEENLYKIDKIGNDFLNDITNVGEDEYEDDQLLRRRDVKSVYPVVTSLLTLNDITRPDEFQVRYSLCRSMWVVLLLLIISYISLLLPTLPRLSWATITVPNPLILIHGEELIWQKVIPLLTIFMVFFVASAGRYKKYYVEYLMIGYYIARNQARDLQATPIEKPESESDKIKNRTGKIAYELEEIEKNVKETNQELEELEKMKKRLATEPDAIEKLKNYKL